MANPTPKLAEIEDSRTQIYWLLESTPDEVVAAWKSQTARQKEVIMEISEITRTTTRRQLLESIQKMVADPDIQLSPLTVDVLAECIARAKRRDEVLKKMRDYRLPPGDFVLSEIKPYIVNSLDVLQKLYLIYSFQYAAIYLQVGKIFSTYKIKIDKDTLDVLILNNASLSKLSRWYQLIMLLADADENKDTISDLDLKNRNDPLVSSLPNDKLVDEVKKSIITTLAEAKVFPRGLIALLQKQDDVAVLFVFVNAIVTAASNLDSLSEIQIRQRVAHLAMIQDLIHLNNQWLLYWGNSAATDKVR